MASWQFQYVQKSEKHTNKKNKIKNSKHTIKIEKNGRTFYNKMHDPTKILEN